MPAADIAELIADGFASYMRGFDAVTARAAERFAGREWKAARADANERLELYERELNRCLAAVRRRLGGRPEDRSYWGEIRDTYAAGMAGDANAAIAETWFNSLSRRLWDTVGVDPSLDFIGPSSQLPDREPEMSATTGGSLHERVRRSLDDARLGVTWDDLDADVDRVVRRLEATVEGVERTGIELLPAAFYRGRACYLVGRLVHDRGVTPLIYSLRHTKRGVIVDAVITDEDRVSILFSFTRSYFHVRVAEPAVLVSFLRSLMPRKRVAELFISIGFNKHGKTELYRDLLDHLANTDARSRLHPASAGSSWRSSPCRTTTSSSRSSRTRFPPPKRTTRSQIRDKYRLVFEHDRAGRLVEAQNSNISPLDRDRFEPELLEALQAEADRTVHVHDDRIVIDHAISSVG